MSRVLGEALVRVRPSIEGFEKESNSKLGTALKGGALAAAAAISVVGAKAIKTGVAYNQLQQTSRAALTTILGGSKAANAQMNKLDKFASTSPFAKEVFIKAQQQLLGFGLSAKRVVPTLDAIQNAVAATGGSSADVGKIADVLAKVKGQGKITGETLNQLGQYGINAAQLIGKQMGKTGPQIRESITKGTLDSGKAFRALTDGMEKRFGGAADNVKLTWSGATDRLKAAWRDFSGALVEPFIGKKGGGLAITWANKLADLVRKVDFNKLGKRWTSVVNAIASTASTLFTNLKAGFSGDIGAESLSGLALVAHKVGSVFAAVWPNVKKFFGVLKDSLSGIDFKSLLTSVSDGVVKMSKGLADSNGPAKTFADTLKVGGAVLKFVADHVDLLVKALPFLIAGYAAVKLAETAQRAGMVLSLPVQIARTVAIRSQTKAMKQLVVAMDSGVVAQLTNTTATAGSTVATEANAAVTGTATKMTIRQRIATLVSAAAQKIAAGATKAYAIAQRVLNAAMRANPIGLVITALLLLAGGLKLAWDHSSTFRRIVKGALHGVTVAFKAVVGWVTKSFVPFFTKKIPAAFQSVLKWVKGHWPLLLGILTGPVGLFIGAFVTYRKQIFAGFRAAWQWVKGTFKGLWNGLKSILAGPIQAAKDIIKSVWSKIQGFFRSGVAKVVDIFLGMVDKIISGAAKAFGWVPGLGDKLKSASDHFHAFRERVNRQLRGIHDKTVSVKVDSNVPKMLRRVRHGTPAQVLGLPGAADGTTVPGSRHPYGDKVLRALAPGEEVISNRHGQADRHRPLLKAINAGMADGGTVFNVRTSGLSRSARQIGTASHSMNAMLRGIAGVTHGVLSKIANSLKNLFSGGGPFGAGDGARVHTHGVTLDRFTLRKLNIAERILGHAVHVSQGSFSTSVAASGSTHAGGGALDITSPVNVRTQNALRRAGFAAWIRNPSQGPWPYHIHGIALGDKLASAAAKAQMWSFQHGGNGLGGGFDNGGVARGTGYMPKKIIRPERVLSPSGTESYDRLGKIADLLEGGGGRPIEVHNHFPTSSEAAAMAGAKRTVDSLSSLGIGR